jgi:succinate-semialdehyde dehydrogenase / glutarate-semialdehyde dehydrogenase
MTTAYDADLALFINGAWRIGEGRDLFPVVDPASGETIGEVPMASPADLDAALEAADSGFKLWRATPVEQRVAVLKKAAALLRERVESIANLLTLEQGKLIAEARAEVLSSAQLFDWCAEEASRTYGRVLVRPSGQRAMVIKQPIGPVAAFSPWHFPIYLMAKKLAPALAAAWPMQVCPPEWSNWSTACPTASADT